MSSTRPEQPARSAARLLAALCAVGMLALPHQAHAQDEDGADREFFVQADANISLLNDQPGRNAIPNEFGYSARAGHRWGNWGVFAQAANNLWTPNREVLSVRQGVLNLGVGAERLLFDRRVRVSAAAGTSTLLEDTVLDDAGATGFFVEVRPVGLRWQMWGPVRLEWDPIIYSLSEPVVSEPELIQSEFKTVLAVEVGL